MTYREKAMEVRPDLISRVCYGGMWGCPFSAFDGAKALCLNTLPECGPSKRRCAKCWHQEYRGEAVLPKEET